MFRRGRSKIYFRTSSSQYLWQNSLWRQQLHRIFRRRAMDKTDFSSRYRTFSSGFSKIIFSDNFFSPFGTTRMRFDGSTANENRYVTNACCSDQFPRVTRIDECQQILLAKRDYSTQQQPSSYTEKLLTINILMSHLKNFIDLSYVILEISHSFLHAKT